jgi:hypothetical protein
MKIRHVVTLGVMLSVCAFSQGPRRGPGGPGDAAFMGAEFGHGKTVAGAPYSAQAVTQVTQTLANGNQINRTVTSAVARDSSGRTMRQETLGGFGPWGGQGNASGTKSVMIHDPVAQVSYVLDTTNKVAHKMTMGNHQRGAARGPAGANGAQPRVARGNRPAPQTESLGTQAINGVSAQGTRITRTIPAGAIGNAQPIQIVTETWYSPDLQVVVMSKTSDPRTGDSVYQLNNIVRAEPDASLFQVPAGYTVSEGPAFRHGPPVAAPPAQ